MNAASRRPGRPLLGPPPGRPAPPAPPCWATTASTTASKTPPGTRRNASSPTSTRSSAAARALDPAALDATDEVTREVLLFEAGTQADSLRSRYAEFLVDPMLGPHMDLVTYIPQMTPVTAEHAAAFVVKASRVGAAFDHAVDRLRDGVANGRTPPRVAVEKVLAQLDAYLASPVEKDPFLAIVPPADMSRSRRGRVAGRHAAPGGGGGPPRPRPLPRGHRRRRAPRRPSPGEVGHLLAPRRRRGLPPGGAPLHLAGDRPPATSTRSASTASPPSKTSTGNWAARSWAPPTSPRSTAASATTRPCASRPPPR